MTSNLTPDERSIHAQEWRHWRRQNPAGARRAWIYLRSHSGANAIKLMKKMGMRVPDSSGGER